MFFTVPPGNHKASPILTLPQAISAANISHNTAYKDPKITCYPYCKMMKSFFISTLFFRQIKITKFVLLSNSNKNTSCNLGGCQILIMDNSSLYIV